MKNISLTQKIEFTSKRTTREKLLAYLSAEAKKAGSSRFCIPFNRQELADYLSVERSAMLAIIFSPVYLAGCFILFRDILRWLQACTKIAEHKVFRTCFIIMGVLISGTPFFGAFWRHSTLQRDVQIFSDFWLGVFMIV